MDAIKLILSYLRVGWRRGWIYNARTLLNLIGSLLILVLQILVWSYLSKDRTVAGYDQQSIITYFTVMYLVGILLSPDCDSWLSRQIISGDISNDLLKPVRVLFFMPFESFSLILYRFIVCGLPVLFITIWIYGIDIPVIRTIAILPLLFFTLIFWVVMEFCFGCLCFHTKAYWGISSLKNALLMFFTGRLLPLEFYPQWLANIIDRNPFCIAYYHVARSLMGEDHNADIISLTIMQLIYALVALVVLSILWRLSIRRLSIQGG